MSLDILREVNGGAKGDRTPDLDNAIVALSQLSYGPLSMGRTTKYRSGAKTQAQSLSCARRVAKTSAWP